MCKNAPLPPKNRARANSLTCIFLPLIVSYLHYIYLLCNLPIEVGKPQVAVVVQLVDVEHLVTHRETRFSVYSDNSRDIKFAGYPARTGCGYHTFSRSWYRNIYIIYKYMNFPF